MQDEIKTLKEQEQDELARAFFGPGCATQPAECSSETGAFDQAVKRSAGRRGLWLALAGLVLLLAVNGRIVNWWPLLWLFFAARSLQSWLDWRERAGPAARPTRTALNWTVLLALLAGMTAVGAPGFWPLALIGVGVLTILNR